MPYKGSFYRRKRYRRRFRRYKRISNSFYRDTVEVSASVQYNGTNNQFTWNGANDGNSLYIANMLNADEGAKSLARIFNLVRVNAVVITAMPVFSNGDSRVDMYNGQVIITYFGSLFQKQVNYNGGIAEGKHTLLLNPFGFSNKFISLKGYTKDYVGLNSVDQDSLPGCFVIFRSDDSNWDVGKCPKWQVTVKLYCLYKK